MSITNLALDISYTLNAGNMPYRPICIKWFTNKYIQAREFRCPPVYFRYLDVLYNTVYAGTYRGSCARFQVELPALELSLIGYVDDIHVAILLASQISRCYQVKCADL